MPGTNTVSPPSTRTSTRYPGNITTTSNRLTTTSLWGQLIGGSGVNAYQEMPQMESPGATNWDQSGLNESLLRQQSLEHQWWTLRFPPAPPPMHRLLVDELDELQRQPEEVYGPPLSLLMKRARLKPVVRTWDVTPKPLP